jgi:Tfp pilus assembly pilus retraction ATPase PilT
MQTARSEGMILMDNYLKTLVIENKISAADA